MKRFGTDGIRGDSSKFPFDGAALFAIGKSVAEVLGKKNAEILIIRDTRESGERIQKALAKGIACAKNVPVFGGVMPTPAAAFLLKKGGYAAGVVISASHNPYNDNGIKIFNSKGSKLADSAEAKIEERVRKYLTASPEVPQGKTKFKEDSSLLKFYEDFIVKSFSGGSLRGKASKGKALKGKTIVVDCANGAAYKSATETLKKLGAKVIALNVKPDGKNINKSCGALHPELAAKTVKERKAFCGFAFDGDADRLICVDENGEIRDGDFFLAAMAKYLKARGKLKNNVLVTTVMANLGLMQAMQKAGIKTLLSKVGDRYVLEDMEKHKASLGGEQSGHFIFKDILGTGDGLLSAVQLLAALNAENKSLSEFVSGVKKFPQVLVNKKVLRKTPLEDLPKSLELVKKYEKELGAQGRILVRYSGTENLLRVMVEGSNKDIIKSMAESIIDSMDAEIKGKS